MKSRYTHVDLPGQVIDPQLNGIVILQPVDCLRDLLTLAAGRGNLPQTCALFANEQTVNDFPLDVRWVLPSEKVTSSEWQLPAVLLFRSIGRLGKK